jgi:hypothetical protein
MKDTYVRARLTTMEKEIFEKKAKNFNMTVSDYIKYCCLINPPKPHGYEREAEYEVNK